MEFFTKFADFTAKHPSVLKSVKILVILIVCFALVNFVSKALTKRLTVNGGEERLNLTAAKFITNILKIIVIAFGVVMIISELGYNINGLITGIGVGGLAVSLAAQDAVSNLISGFIILFDKPFKIGDYIQTKDIAGTVEDLSMRCTKIRTLENSVVTMPNNKLTGDAVVNISRIQKRLIQTEYGVLYSTTNTELQAIKNEVTAYLTASDDILPDAMRVEFVKLDDSSINLEIFCYTPHTDIQEYYAVLTDVNLAIKEIVERHTEFAFPSNSVYIEKK